MTSQRWLTDADFAPSSQAKSIWWHWLVVIVPDELKYTRNASMWITGGGMSSNLPTADSEDILVSAALACSVGSVTAVLFQVTPLNMSPHQFIRSRMNTSHSLLILFKSQELRMLLLLTLGIISSMIHLNQNGLSDSQW